MPLALEAQLDAAHAPLTASAEVYVLGPSDDVNVKIRGRQLDIKKRLLCERGLELWVPVLKAPFPMNARSVTSAFLNLRLAQPRIKQSPVTIAEFLETLDGPENRWRIVHVIKSRRQAVVGACTIERASVETSGQVIETAAIESTQHHEVLQLARELDFVGHDNESYVAGLRRLLSPLPNQRVV